MTGPQRSGTTLGARVLAELTGLEYVDEEHFGVHDCRRFEALLAGSTVRSKGVVIHCPAMSRWVHHYSTEQRCIVFMLRDIDQINASAERVGWNYEPELAKYKDIVLNGARAPMLNVTRGNLVHLTYEYWQQVQRPACKHWLEVHFDTLRGHPLFVPDHQREHFALRQWRVNQ